MKNIDKYEFNEHFLYDPESHFWVDIAGPEARIGMSSLLQETSGNFVAISFDGLNKEVKKGQSFGSIEAEKYVGPLNAPVSGVIAEINDQVIENPRLVNTDPYGNGWLIKLKLSDLEAEISNLIKGKDQIQTWFESELKKFEEKGWISQ